MGIIYSKCYNGVIMVGGFADDCNMHNMQNMSNNMPVLQYAEQYAKYAKQYAEK